MSLAWAKILIIYTGKQDESKQTSKMKPNEQSKEVHLYIQLIFQTKKKN